MIAYHGKEKVKLKYLDRVTMHARVSEYIEEKQRAKPYKGYKPRTKKARYALYLELKKEFSPVSQSGDPYYCGNEYFK